MVVYLLLLALVDFLAVSSPASAAAVPASSGGGSPVIEVRRSPRQTIQVSAMPNVQN